MVPANVVVSTVPLTFPYGRTVPPDEAHVPVTVPPTWTRSMTIGVVVYVWVSNVPLHAPAMLTGGGGAGGEVGAVGPLDPPHPTRTRLRTLAATQKVGLLIIFPFR